MSSCVNNNALQIDNYTGQPLKLVMVKVSRDADGYPISDANGVFSFDLISKEYSVPQSTGTQDGQYTVINSFLPTYDGFSAITSDGKNTVTVGLDYAAAPTKPISFNINTADCSNVWVSICSYDGTNYKCLSGDGTEFKGYESDFPGNMDAQLNNNAIVSPGGIYYGPNSSMHWIIILIILIIIIIIVAFVVRMIMKKS